MPTLPTFPVCELITQDLLAAIQLVTVANGYHVDLAPERRKKGGNRSGPYVAVLNDGWDREPGPQEPEGTGGAPFGHVHWLRRYELWVFVFDDDGSTVPYEQLLNVARADVETAICADRQRSNLAMNTFVRDPEPLVMADEVGGVIVNFDVFYRTLEDNPYEL